MATDLYSGIAPPMGGPFRFAAAVTPSDGADLAQVSNALYVGVTGNIAVILSGQQDKAAVVFANVAVGYHWLRAARVMATGTTASGIVAVW